MADLSKSAQTFSTAVYFGKRIIRGVGSPMSDWNLKANIHCCETMQNLPDERDSRGYGLNGNKVLYSAGDTTSAYSRNILVMINTGRMNDIRIEDRATFDRRKGTKYIPSVSWSVSIAYCPFCGEKLIEEAGK